MFYLFSRTMSNRVLMGKNVFYCMVYTVSKEIELYVNICDGTRKKKKHTIAVWGKKGWD